jgi:hypothetical protein
MLDLLTYLLVTGIVYTLPISLALWWLRRRLSVVAASVSLGVGFAAATAFSFYRFEWFDVWRHGVPPLGYMITEYGPPMVILGAIGAAFGALLVRRKSKLTIFRL